MMHFPQKYYTTPTFLESVHFILLFISGVENYPVVYNILFVHLILVWNSKIIISIWKRLINKSINVSYYNVIIYTIIYGYSSIIILSVNPGVNKQFFYVVKGKLEILFI